MTGALEDRERRRRRMPEAPEASLDVQHGLVEAALVPGADVHVHRHTAEPPEVLLVATERGRDRDDAPAELRPQSAEAKHRTAPIAHADHQEAAAFNLELLKEVPRELLQMPHAVANLAASLEE